MKENGKMDKNMDKEFILVLTEIDTLVFINYIFIE